MFLCAAFLCSNKYTLCLKNVPPLVCYNFDTRECILIFFGRNVTDKVSNQKALYCATSNNVCFCTTLQNGETRKSHFFSLKCCISALPEFKQSLLDFFSLFDSRLILLYDSLNLVTNAFSLGLLGGMVQEKGSGQCRSSWTCTMHMNQYIVFLKEKCHLWCVWQRLTFIEIVRYPINAVHRLSLQAWWRTTPIFYTATDTITDLVHRQRAGNRQQDAILRFYVGFNCLMHTVDHFGNEG